LLSKDKMVRNIFKFICFVIYPDVAANQWLPCAGKNMVFKEGKETRGPTN
jgi:hypothetical protein